MIGYRSPLLAKASPLKGALPLASVINSINYVDVPTQGRWDDVFSGDGATLVIGWCLPRRFLAGEMSLLGNRPDTLLVSFLNNFSLQNSRHHVALSIPMMD